MGLWSLESCFESNPASHTERCPSGLRSTLGKRVLGKLNRGFESHPLRHSPCFSVIAVVVLSAKCARTFGRRSHWLPLSQLIADLPYESPSCRRMIRLLHSQRRLPIHHPHHSSTLLGLRHNRLHRIRRRTKDRAHLKAIANAAQNVDRVSLPQTDHEHGPRA